MYFDIKNYLKNNLNRTTIHTLKPKTNIYMITGSNKMSLIHISLRANSIIQFG